MSSVSGPSRSAVRRFDPEPAQWMRSSDRFVGACNRCTRGVLGDISLGVNRSEDMPERMALQRRSRSRSILMGISLLVLIPAFLFAGYLVSANILLRTRLLRSMINDGPDKTYVEYGSAYSLWPGRVRVRDLRIRDR